MIIINALQDDEKEKLNEAAREIINKDNVWTWYRYWYRIVGWNRLVPATMQ